MKNLRGADVAADVLINVAGPTLRLEASAHSEGVLLSGSDFHQSGVWLDGPQHVGLTFNGTARIDGPAVKPR